MLIQSLTQAALGSLGLHPARPWHITHTPLWTLTVASKQLCKDFGGDRALQVSGKTGKGLWGHRGHCLPSTRRILPYTLQSLSANSKHGVQTPVVVGSSLPRVGTAAAALLGVSLLLLHFHSKLHSFPDPSGQHGPKSWHVHVLRLYPSKYAWVRAAGISGS